MVDDQFIPLLDVATELLDGFPIKTAPTYWKLHNAAQNRRIPAERMGGRWFVRRSKLPAVIAALGLMPEHTSSTPAMTAPAAV